MKLLQDDGVRIVRRGRKARDHRYIAPADIAFLLKWPLCRLAAAAMPPRAWPALLGHRGAMTQIAATHASRAVCDRIGRALDVDDAAARAILAANLRHKSERLLQIARINAAAYAPEISLDGADVLQAARAAGRGAVLWVAHTSFGSTIGKIALHRAGYDVFHLSRREHGFSQTRFGMRWLNPIRTGAEDRFLAGRIVLENANPGASVLKARRRLAGNAFVSVTEGAWEGSRIAEGNLFGGTMRLATGAPALAALAQCPLLPVFVIRSGDAFCVRIEPSVMPAGGVDRESRIAAATQAFLAHIEKHVRAHPQQWDSWKYLDFAPAR